MVDSEARVTGDIQYALNFELPGMLHARILRSPHPHARIVRVDTSKAESVPGVAAVLSRNDLLDNDQFFPYFGPVILDQNPVALDKVRFVGDPVAAVAAVDEDAATEALGLIEVEYEELPAVFDPEQALQPGAPLIHEGPHRVVPGRMDIRGRSLEGTNIMHLYKQRKGDVTKGFQESDLIFENAYSGPAVEHVTLEPHVCVAEVRDGQVTLWSSSQNPHSVQAQVASVFKKPIAEVRVIVFTLGGGYGGKLNAKIEPIAALLAWKAHRPVKLVLPRQEEFLVNTQHACTVKLKTGVKRDGRLVAQEAYCYYDGGPYADSTPNLITRGYAATGPYVMPNLHTDSYGVYTNSVPAGAFRGYGITQVAWAHEGQMDIIADALGMDPLELRMKNVLHTGDPFTTGEPAPELHYTELLEQAAKTIGWNDGPLVVRDGTKVRAKGISAIIKGMATPTTSTAAVKLNADGSLNVLTSTVEMGQGCKTVLAQIAADEAGVALEKVRVSEPDTSFTPYDLMTAASRSTFCMGTAIRYAVQDVKEQVLDLAAGQLEVGRDDLLLEEGSVSVRGVPSRSLGYVDVIRGARRFNLLGHGSFVASAAQDDCEVVMDFETGQGHGSAEWHPAVAACVVEVDTETGKVDVLRLHAGLYAGRVVNPQLSELQVQGAATFAMSQSLFEEVVVDANGAITNPNLSDYMIPSFKDVPMDFSVYLHEPPGVTEVHGIGETSLPPVRPAIANAICRAIGARVFDLPITPEKVLAAGSRDRPSA
ncbi:MAG: xanthine dehydrogenase family protein molybdopterin-binding subunit, partial [Chloroflexota bacterium]